MLAQAEIDTVARFLAPFLVVLLDVVLTFFFLLMAVHGARFLRLRFVAFAGVFAATFPIDLMRFVGIQRPWLDAVNVLWTSLALGGVAFLLGVSWRKSAFLLLGSAGILLGLLGVGVSTPLASSVGNGLLATTGVLVAGRLYRVSHGFATGNLAALWLLFLLHGASFHRVAAGGPVAVAHGFMLVVLILWCQALFGYLYLPRELEGRVPVQLPATYLVVLTSTGGSAVVLFNFMAPRFSQPQQSLWIGTLALGAAVAVLAPLGAAFVRHRLELAVHADDVERLLAERTAETLEQKAQLERQNRQLEQRATDLLVLATVDALTGLKNRRVADESLARECARALRYGVELSCLLVDIDHFKSINDSLGHEAGDTVLASVAKTIRERVRAPDIACRVGGEEFLVICPDTDARGVRALAESLRRCVESATHGGNHVTVSGGVATFRKGDGPESVRRRVDAGLYCAKNGGRNRIESSEASGPGAAT